jgi:hypothetical protein
VGAGRLLATADLLVDARRRYRSEAIRGGQIRAEACGTGFWAPSNNGWAHRNSKDAVRNGQGVRQAARASYQCIGYAGRVAIWGHIPSLDIPEKGIHPALFGDMQGQSCESASVWKRAGAARQRGLASQETAGSVASIENAGSGVFCRCRSPASRTLATGAYKCMAAW